MSLSGFKQAQKERAMRDLRQTLVVSGRTVGVW